MGSDASKDYKGPANPETDNNIYVVEKFSDYMNGEQINSYNIWVLLVMVMTAIFFLLSIMELLWNISYYRIRKKR
jgi:hypothetical protein